VFDLLNIEKDAGAGEEEKEEISALVPGRRMGL
jgi:hypothetical protein